jgi:hypothetical protein
MTVYTYIRLDFQSQLLLSANKQKFEAVKIINFRFFSNFRFFFQFDKFLTHPFFMRFVIFLF